MGHIQDRWTKPGPSGRRQHTERWGNGLRWQARWVDPDGQRRVQGAATKDEAAAILARVAVDMASGAYVSPVATAEPFRVYAERWRTQQLHHRPATATQAESRLRLHVYPVIGQMPLGRIRRSDVQALVTGMAAALAPATVEVAYGYVSAIFKAAVEDRAVASSPCVRISLPAVPRSRVQPLTFQQVAQIRDQAPAHWKALVDLAAATGMRSGELRGLTVDRISPPLHVVGAPAVSVVIRVDRQLAGRELGGAPLFAAPKSAASDRSIRVGRSTSTALVEHLREFGVGPGGLVFASQRQPGALSRSRAGEVWRDATEGMALRPRSGWHDLRHHHASLLIAAGISVRAVADRLGHQDPAETLRTYAHLWPDDEERAVAAVERVYGAR